MLSMLLIAALQSSDAPEQPQSLAGTSNTTVETVRFEPSKWQLVWSDEFDKNGPPDPKKWGYEIGYLRNNETQYYTDDPKNVRVEGGKLVIEAHKDSAYERGVSSASVTTEGKQDFLYGRIEALAKIPTGKGTWPAIWTLGTNIREAGWPQCGELDILENVGFDPMRIHANVHTGSFNHTKGNGRGNSIVAEEKPWERFNLYAVEWYEDRVEFFFNDTRYLVVTKGENDDDGAWPFHAPQYLIVNLAIGGAWGGAQGVDLDLLPHRYEIDYVRYYKLK